MNRLPAAPAGPAGLLLLALATAGCDQGTGPDPLPVVVVAIDRDANGTDPDGVTLTSGSQTWTVEVGGTLVLRDLPAGSHSFQLGGLARHCFSDESAATVQADPGDSVNVRLSVACFGGFAYGLWFSPDDHQVRYLGQDGVDIALTGTVGRNFPRQWSPDGETLALTTTVGGSDDIYLVERDGSGLRPLVEHPYVDIDPRWSPDGEWLAYSRFPSWGAVPWTAVYLIRPDGTDERVLLDTTSHDSDPSWAPDGETILLTTLRFGSQRMATVTPAGTGLAVLGAGNHPSWPQWSPDGSRVSYVDWENGSVQDAWVMNADGTGPVNISSMGQTSPARWAPDGSELLFASAADGEIHRVAPDGSGRVSLTENDAYDGSPAWSPDGEWILFGSDRDGSQDLYVMDRDGGRVWRLHLSTGVSTAYAGLWNPTALPESARP